jgi:hypothetical protein
VNLPAVSSRETEFREARESASAATAARAGGHDLEPLKIGDRVHYRRKPDEPWCVGAEVTEVRPSGRSYTIDTPGGVFVRGRALLRRAVDAVEEEPAVPVVVEVAVPVPAGLPGPVAPRCSARIRKMAKKVTFAL